MDAARSRRRAAQHSGRAVFALFLGVNLINQSLDESLCSHVFVCLPLADFHCLTHIHSLSPKLVSQLFHTRAHSTPASSQHAFLFPTSGGKLLGVDDFGSIFLTGGDLHAPPDHRECAPWEGNKANMSTSTLSRV